MGKGNKTKVWQIENYYFSTDDEKNKIIKLLNKYYDDYWKGVLSREITREEFNDVSNHKWPLTEESLLDIHYLVEHDRSYGKDDGLLNSIFASKILCKNNDKNIVALKATLIDFTNSTNLNKQRDVMTLDYLAETITKLDFDNRLLSDGNNLVKDIALINKNVRLWSFASKYALYHDYFVNKGDNFVIYDQILRNNLWRYSNGKFSKTWIEKIFAKNSNVDNPYKEYKDTIDNILDEHNINLKNRRRLFDHFIWWQFKGLTLKGKKS